MVDQQERQLKLRTTRKGKEVPKESKKWQQMFRYRAEREKAIRELVEFVHLVHTLAKHATYSPDSIRDTNGGKIYL